MRLSLLGPCLATLVATLAGAACSPPSAPQPDKPPAPQTDAAVRALHAPLDRAKALEGQAQATHDAQDKQIDAAMQ